jgi:peptidoglycan/LPS O-acetylase OafA/YrhL
MSTSTASAPTGTRIRARTDARLPSLTGLRWIAALMVWGFHLRTVDPTSNDRVSAVFQPFTHGALGVSFFFVLSGFVLVWSARPGDTAGRFLRRRFAKIYPNHAVALVFAVVLVALTTGGLSAKTILSNALLINSWLLRPGWPNAINAVSWTLCCEAFFYVSLPFLLPRLRRLTTERLYIGLALVPLGALLVGTVIRTLVPHPHVDNIGFFPPMRYHEFLVGVIVGELMVRNRWAGPRLWPSLGLVVIAYVAHFFQDMSVVIPLAFASLIASAASADLSGAWSPWRWRPLVLLGEASYAFYLVHHLVMVTAVRVGEWLDPGRRFWFGAQPVLGGAGLYVVGTLAVAIVLAFAMYYGVERPMMKGLRPKPRRPALGAELDSEKALPQAVVVGP